MEPRRRPYWIAAVLVVAALFCGFAGVLWLTSQLSRVPTSLVRVTSSDEKLQEAIKRARKIMPDFTKRLKHPSPGDRFAIKAKFATPLEPEYLWIKDPVAKDRGFTGIVDQVPIAVPGLHKGDKVTVKQADVVDWLLQSADGSTAGQFTDQALAAGAH